MDPVTRGHPESPLRWTCKSTAKLAEELTRQNHPVTDRTVATLLKRAGYSLQANRKTREGSSHPDRNAQFEHINKQVLAFQKQNQPVISVDTKKKELVGEFKNPGQEWQPKGEPEKVKVHDFPDKRLGKAIPYGVYDLASNEGWVSVGIDHDTAQFAAASIRRWWTEMGSQRFPRANKLLITADGGGSNSSRNRLWKKSLQELADELDLTLQDVPFSAWHQQVEQDRASFVLLHHQELARTSADHLRSDRELDREHDDQDGARRPRGHRLQRVRNWRRGHRRRTRIASGSRPSKFHGEWNYTIKPRR